MENQVFRAKDGWKLTFNGVVARALWSERGPAEAQLDLLNNGYSAIDCEGHIVHRPKPSSLDSMIMDVEVSRVLPNDRINIKFVAITGGTGPSITIPRSLAVQLRDKLIDGLRSA